MNHFTQGRLADSITLALKEAAQEVLDTCSAHDDLRYEMERKVNSKLTGLTSGLYFRAPISSDTHVDDISYRLTSTLHGKIRGEVVIAHRPKKDVLKYGDPGYPGKRHGDLCVYPEHSRNFYKWNANLCRWEAILRSIDRDNRNAMGWYDKLTHNPAFRPIWGSNTHGGDLHSGRDGKGQHELWGTLPIREPMGTFQKVVPEMMKSIYDFCLNIKSVMEHFEGIGSAFGYENDEGEVMNADYKTAYPTDEEPKVTIKINKVNHWHYFMNNGHIDQSGAMIIKDTTVYMKDINKVQLETKNKNSHKKRAAREDFDNNN